MCALKKIFFFVYPLVTFISTLPGNLIVNKTDCFEISRYPTRFLSYFKNIKYILLSP